MQIFFFFCFIDVLYTLNPTACKCYENKHG